ncbi:RNA polymerase sigma factor [Sphingobacterium paucimobilis]|uniref:RNA polymerase sigma factor SigS n=1 Tax=Sphingobacterium paucimobilis HER1398 TaxID=1346330 RepID=U2J4Q0_9SPHI|nr:sigma-70 family RNA polymerase sigma factor [Sphingobacterium paucimobilis]ERJ57618.1 hypothetical protein M472_02445 [Sphingobacterium paucimobilis HER1398]
MFQYSELSDIELVELIRSNDQEAFTCLYERFKRPLLLHALQKIDSEQAEDAVHDVLAKLWDSRQEFIVQISVRAYLYTALRNRIIDILIHSNHGQKYINSLKSYASSFVVEKTDYRVREKMFLEQIDQVMAEFSEREQQLLKLRMEGYKNPEIAEQLGISEKTVRNQYSAILKKLKSKLFILYLFLLF